jgi:hypothetical protein
MSSKPKLSLRPSGASVWTSCTRSPIFLFDNHDKVHDDESSYAAEGILAHTLAAEWLLLGKLKADQFPNTEMLRFVSAYTRFISEERTEFCEQFVEKKVDLFYMPGRHGFVDVGHVNRERLQVIDLKYGAGVAVNAFQNRQLAIYARSLAEELRLQFGLTGQTKVEIIIYQPRVFRGEKISRWSMGLNELFNFTDEIAATAATIKQAHKGDRKALASLKFEPNESNCQFCGAAAFCKARAEWLLGDTTLFEDLEAGASIVDESETHAFLLGDADATLAPGVLQRPERMDPALRVALVKKRNAIVKWLDNLETYTFNRLRTGNHEDAPNLKIVHGKPGSRYWNDPECVEFLLSEHIAESELFKRSMLSPRQAEDFLKGKPLDEDFMSTLASLTSRKNASMTMVDISDPRPEASDFVDASQEFTNLNQVDQELASEIAADMLA